MSPPFFSKEEEGEDFFSKEEEGEEKAAEEQAVTRKERNMSVREC